MNNSMNNYVIKISCTSKGELCYNNKKISIKNYNKLNFDKLLDTIEYIKKVLMSKDVFYIFYSFLFC